MADSEAGPCILEFGREILHDEARALDALADSLGEAFESAVHLILDCRGKLIVSGLGKSGHVARKIAATFASTGTTATFLHLAEAIHGDLGMAAKGDVAILISQSGETAELEPVIDHFVRVGIPIVGITGNSGSMLAEAAAAALVLPHWREHGPQAGAPTTSTRPPHLWAGSRDSSMAGGRAVIRTRISSYVRGEPRGAGRDALHRG